MHVRNWRWTAVVAGLLLAVLTVGNLRAAEPELLSETADGQLELQGETEIELVGMVGTFSMRLGKSGELRFAARVRENRREPLAVQLWVDGSRLILTAPEGSADQARLLEVTVPPEMTVRVDAVSSVVRVNGIRGDLSVVGEDLDVDARGVIGDILLDLVKSKAVLVGSDRALDLNLVETDLRIDQASGPLRMTQSKGRSEIIQLLSDIQLDVEDGVVSGQHVEGVLEVTAHRTTLDWGQLRGGGTLQLSESPLVFSESQGVIEIETDAAVKFSGARGPLQIHGFGADVQGDGATAMVEIESTDAAVSLSSTSGPVVIRGRGLEVSVRSAKNSIKLETDSSTILLDDCAGTIDVRNDFGDVKILTASQKVRVESSEGVVEVRDLRAPIELKADGPEVSVDWAEIAGDQDSTIENPGGTVNLTIPQGAGGCTVEAVSEYGAVESSIPGVELDGGSNRANVVIRAPKPKVKVSAGGDISLALGNAAASPGNAPSASPPAANR